MFCCCSAVFLVLYIALVCCPNVRRKHPTNLVLLGIFVRAIYIFPILMVQCSLMYVFNFMNLQ